MIAQFGATIKSKVFCDISNELVEKVLDNELFNEVIRQTRIRKHFVAVRNIYASYSERILLIKFRK
jgi:hypothetical protein